MHSNIITEKVKKDYDSIAAEFSETRNFPWDEFKIFEKFYDRKFDILDLGCGNGRLLTFFKKKGYRSYIGVDQSVELLKFAKKNFADEEFKAMDFSKKMKFKKKFDAIFFIASFHHIPAELQRETLENCKNYLNKGGYIFMTNWNLRQKKYFPLYILSILAPKYGFLGLLIPWKNKVMRYYYAFSKKRLSKLFNDSGFKIVINDYYHGSKISNFFKAKNIITVAKYE